MSAQAARKDRAVGAARPLGKYDLLDRWVVESTPSSSPLAQAAKGAGCKLDSCVHVMTRLVMASRPDGTCSESYAQLAAKTALPEHKVQRALRALTAAGALKTVQKACGPGRGKQGHGRPAVRRIEFLAELLVAQLVDIPEKTVQYDHKDRAPDCTAPRSFHSTDKTPSKSLRTAQPAAPDKGRGKPHQQPTKTEQRKATPAARRLAMETARRILNAQPAGTVRSPEGWARNKTSQVLDLLAELQASSNPTVAQRWRVAVELDAPGRVLAAAELHAMDAGQQGDAATGQFLDAMVSEYLRLQAQPA